MYMSARISGLQTHGLYILRIASNRPRDFPVSSTSIRVAREFAHPIRSGLCLDRLSLLRSRQCSCPAQSGRLNISR